MPGRARRSPPGSVLPPTYEVAPVVSCLYQQSVTETIRSESRWTEPGLNNCHMAMRKMHAARNEVMLGLPAIGDKRWAMKKISAWRGPIWRAAGRFAATRSILA